jgi:hypothetical protein
MLVAYSLQANKPYIYIVLGKKETMDTFLQTIYVTNMTQYTRVTIRRTNLGHRLSPERINKQL